MLRTETKSYKDYLIAEYGSEKAADAVLRRYRFLMPVDVSKKIKNYHPRNRLVAYGHHAQVIKANED